MLTPQEVSNSVFEKAVFGGYDISAVDQFVEKLTKDYTELYRENETLKDRLRLLADRIEEYRTSEDAMRLALLSAKRAAREAEEKAKASRAEAEAAAAAASAEKGSREAAAMARSREEISACLQKFRTAAADCEALLEELCSEAVPAEKPAAEAEKPAEAADVLDFRTLNFGFPANE